VDAVGSLQLGPNPAAWPQPTLQLGVKTLRAQQTVTGNSKCLKNNSVTEVMLTWTQNRWSQRQREWHRKQECQRLLNWTPLEQHTVAAFIYISINGATTDDWQSLTCRNKK